MRALSLVLLLAAGPAWAESHGVTVQNGTAETIRLIQISPAPGAGENRLRSQLPPGASGRIAYSTGCQATVRIGYEGGRTEDHAVDACTDPRIVAGTDGVAGPSVSNTNVPGTSVPSRGAAAAVPGAPARSTAGSPAKPVAAKVELAPPPVVPPWTGKSITKRFGGMD